MSNTINASHREPGSGPEFWIEAVRKQARSIQYGTVQIAIHDGRVTQIEATEKVRIPLEASSKDQPNHGRSIH